MAVETIYTTIEKIMLKKEGSLLVCTGTRILENSQWTDPDPDPDLWEPICAMIAGLGTNPPHDLLEGLRRHQGPSRRAPSGR